MKKKKHILLIIGASILVTFILANSLFVPSTVSAVTTATMPSSGEAHLKVADISVYNDSVLTSSDNINFPLLKTQVDAVYIRSFDHANGVLSVDKQADNYAKSAEKAGLLYGFYFYYTPTKDLTDAVNQAYLYYSFIKNYAYSCVPVLDAEDNSNNLTKAEYAAAIKAFADTFQTISGINLMMYTYPYFIYTTFDTTFSWDSYLLWIAHYNVSAPMEGISASYMPPSNWCWEQWDMWQYTSKGILSSVPNSAAGHLDLSYATDNILLAPPVSAAISSIVVPDNIQAGAEFTAQATVTNTNRVAWTENTSIRLGVCIGNTQTRGILPAGVSVAPGESYTFTFTGTAPATGDLVIRTQMLKEGVCWFGETKSAVVKSTNGVITSITGPLATLPGDMNNIQVTAKNTGLSTWSEGKNFRLGITSGALQDRVILPAGITVAPGQSYTFTYQAKAPLSGTLTVSTKMLEEGVAWFGEGKTYSAIVKNPGSAEITSAVISEGSTAGTYKAMITVKNTDQVSWTEKNMIRLGAFTGSTQTRAILPAGVTVAPGASYTFTLSGTTPATGDLQLVTQMVQDGVCWFGDTKTVTVSVNDASITSITGPAAMLPGEMNTLQMTVKNTGLRTWSEGKSFRLGIMSGSIQDRVILLAGVSVAPGQSYTFSYQVIAPQSGTFTATAKMLLEGVAWFGEGKTYSAPVKNPSAAEITSATLSEGITAGGAYTATITVKNTDQVPWTEKNLVRLGIITGDLQTRVNLPADVTVAPGASYTFIFTGIAPASGSLAIDIQMVQDGVSWFGENETLTAVLPA